MACVQRDGLQGGVGAGLADAVEPATVAVHRADAAHARRQHGQHAAAPVVAGLDERQDQRQGHHRPEHVGVHHAVEVFPYDRLRTFAARTDHAGVVDGHVERLAIELPAQPGQRAGVGQVQLVGLGAERLERRHALIAARGGDDAPAVGTVLADKLETETARGAKDEGCGHGRTPVVVVGMGGNQTISMPTAVASPPPMQRLATPRLPPVLRRAPISVVMMRAPEAPIGWPSAHAPP
ncbi:hypothetical protein D3C87_1211300 [compost metagenome]